ncbi:MAG: L-lysine dehydrogenase [Alphaproteobacteria bacterium]|nr:MAG: L-lysine dehydrogenase [Alphaproteobacteria bacterium]
MQRVAVLGLGKVGALAAELLADAGFTVLACDRAAPPVPLSMPVTLVDVTDSAALTDLLATVDGVLSCLPYHLNADLARIAHRQGCHYFDLTEDVPTTRAIQALAETGGGVMAPQCGLAPGLVGIVAAAQIAGFDQCRSCRMRVGALPRYPTGRMGYAFNWSPEGVVNEYLNDCEVIEDGHRKLVSPMEWLETLYIDGVKLEAFTTSGGLGTMCDTYLGRVANLDYKTIRYPGHADLMNLFFHELLMRERRAEAGAILVHAKPPVTEDIVYVHIASEGVIAGRLSRQEYVRAFRPRTLLGRQRTAIAWTTALVRAGSLPPQGFLRQEDIPLTAWLGTVNGRLFEAA